MIPLVQGAPPATQPVQPAKAGTGDFGTAFGGLLAAMLPAGPDAAGTDTVGAPEGTGTDSGPAGQESAATGEALGGLPLPNGAVLPLPAGVLPDTPANGQVLPEAGDASAVPASAPAAVSATATDAASATGPSSGQSDTVAPATGAPDVAPAVPGPGVAGFGIPGAGPSPNAEPTEASALVSKAPGADDSAVVGDTGTVLPSAGTEPDGSGSGDARASAGHDGTRPAAELEVPATAPRQEMPSAAAGAAGGSGAQPASAPAPALAAQSLPMPVFQQAAAAPRQDPVAGVSAVSGGSAPAVGNVLSGEAQTQTQPLNRQLAGPIASLATGPHGERTLSVNVAPEALGPVTVKAHLGHDGLRVELTAPTEAGREALRAMLPELRRDLAATGAGSVSIGTGTGSGAGSDTGTGPGPGTHPGGGQGPAGGDQRFGGPSPLPGRPRGEVTPPPPTPASPPAHASSHLDVMA